MGKDGKLLQEVFFRLDKAMQAFFRRIDAGEKPGFPRVKPRHQFFTLCYPAYRLHIGITHLTEQPPGRSHEVAVSRDARGNYYCSFVYDDSVDDEVDKKDEMHKRPRKRKQHEKRADGIVAFDLGIKSPATGGNDQGRFYHIGGFKGYRCYNKQRDCLHKASYLIAGKPAERAVVIGDLSQRQMVIKKQATLTQPLGV